MNDYLSATFDLLVIGVIFTLFARRESVKCETFRFVNEWLFLGLHISTVYNIHNYTFDYHVLHTENKFSRFSANTREFDV